MKLILLPAIFLSLLGLTMMVSISPSRVLLQSIFVVLSGLIGWIFYRIGIRTLVVGVWPLYIPVLIFLVLTFAFGTVTRGAVRWLSFGGVKFQASEMAKPILMLTSLHFFSRGWAIDKKNQLRMFAGAALAAGGLVLTVAVQPDLGTAMSLMAIFVSAMMMAAVPRWIFSVFFILSLVILVPLGKYGLKDYQSRRLESFVNPYFDPKGAGYQVIQSTIAVGSGMWTGRGLGRGTQSQLKFLPERHTDFIFASIVEELGFVGGVLVLGLYSLMITGLVREGLRTNDRLGRLALGSTAGWLFFQSAVNILMNLGLSPVTGITLPFLSSGGSSVVASAAILGLALSVVKTRS